MDLCSHKNYFSVIAEWVFFATSCYKSPCNDIGGAVKQHAGDMQPSEASKNLLIIYFRLQSHARFMWKWNDVDQVFFEFVRRAWSVLKILRNDMKMGTLYLAHGVAMISFHCHPRNLP